MLIATTTPGDHQHPPSTIASPRKIRIGRYSRKISSKTCPPLLASADRIGLAPTRTRDYRRIAQRQPTAAGNNTLPMRPRRQAGHVRHTGATAHPEVCETVVRRPMRRRNPARRAACRHRIATGAGSRRWVGSLRRGRSPDLAPSLDAPPRHSRPRPPARSTPIAPAVSSDCGAAVAGPILSTPDPPPAGIPLRGPPPPGDAGSSRAFPKRHQTPPRRDQTARAGSPGSPPRHRPPARPRPPEPIRRPDAPAPRPRRAAGSPLRGARLPGPGRCLGSGAPDRRALLAPNRHGRRRSVPALAANRFSLSGHAQSVWLLEGFHMGRNPIRRSGGPINRWEKKTRERPAEQPRISRLRSTPNPRPGDGRWPPTAPPRRAERHRSRGVATGANQRHRAPLALALSSESGDGTAGTRAPQPPRRSRPEGRTNRGSIIDIVPD